MLLLMLPLLRLPLLPPPPPPCIAHCTACVLCMHSCVSMRFMRAHMRPLQVSKSNKQHGFVSVSLKCEFLQMRVGDCVCAYVAVCVRVSGFSPVFACSLRPVPCATYRVGLLCGVACWRAHFTTPLSGGCMC